MRRMHGLVGALVVAMAWGLGTAARAQDENPFGDGGDKALLNDTKQAKQDDNPFGAPADTLRQLKKVERAVKELAGAGHTDVSLSDKPKQVSTCDRVREALASPTKMEFTEMPLQDGVDYLKDYHGIEIQLDNRALEDAGVGTDTPVTRTLNGLPLSSALKLLLGEYDLTYLVRDGVLMITTEAASRDYLELKVYDVSKLVREDAKASEVAAALGLLRQPQPPPEARAASSEPAPDNFTVVPFGNLLIIRAPQHDHEELEKLFTEMKAKLGPND